MQVAVAAATLWTDPARPRPVDAPALAAPSDVRGWVAAMTAAQRADLHGRVLTQLLLGEEVLVEEVREGWALVIATGQPSRFDARGYPGWLPAAQLGEGVEAPASHVVTATATALRDEPDGDLLIPNVVMGTRLAAVDEAYHGWLPVRVPGRDEPAWALVRDVAAAPTGTPDPADVLGAATGLLDVPYVWGGLSAHGIDCSGLVHLAYRRFGVALPRDAEDQAQVTHPVPDGEERPGDLYVFARDGGPAHHVGFVAAVPDADGTRHLLHACGDQGRVVREPMPADRVATLVGARRVKP